MKNHALRLAAIAGLLAATVSPANAGHNDTEYGLRFGPAYVHYNDAYRYDRDYRHRRNHEKRHHRQHHRRRNTHDRWHWNNDGRRDRYYYYDHSDMHHELRHGHRDLHRGGGKHR